MKLLDQEFPGSIAPEGRTIIDATLQEINEYPLAFSKLPEAADFSGKWVVNEELSQLKGDPSEISLANIIKIVQRKDSLILERNFKSYPFNMMTLPFNDNSVHSKNDSITDVSRNIIWSKGKQLLTIYSLYRISGQTPFEFSRTETLSLMEDRRLLLYQRITFGPMGVEKSRVVYDLLPNS